MEKIKLNIPVAVCVFLMALAVRAGAITHYVSPGQNIQAAIDGANNGDEIEVAPGTYNKAIDLKGKAIRIYSTGGPEVTIIDANGIAGAYHVIQCISGEGTNTILKGFTITGGNANGASYPDTCGGGMYNYGSSPTVINCIFRGNTVNDTGGGMLNWTNSNPIVKDCIFIFNNAADYGGGMCNHTSSPTITNCTFSGNEAAKGGGGMINYSSSGPKVTNCTFISNNSDFGGGMYNVTYASPTVTNCTFSVNTASDTGGGMCNEITSSPILTNSILWGNTPDSIYDDLSGSTIVTYSDVESGTGQSWFGTGCIDADPLFVSTIFYYATEVDLRLSSSASPCVDTGDNGAPGLPSTDLAGNPRVVDGDRNGTARVDMGALELQNRSIHNITQDRWYDSIQASIADSYSRNEIEVGPGTYHEAIIFYRLARLYSKDGPEVTTIDGNGAYHTVDFKDYDVADTILEGFTITGGNAAGASEPNNLGGGIYIGYWSHPTVTNCILRGNTADFGGGIAIAPQSMPTVSNCTFVGNKAVYAYGYGGGIHIGLSNPVFTNCVIMGNFANYGGAISSFAGNPVFTNCVITGNTTNLWCGGMYNDDLSNPTVTNCIFWGNGGWEISNGKHTVTYSDVEGGYFGTGNINADPCFVDANNPDPNLWNLRLKPDSPCIDAGDSTGLMAMSVAFDLDGKDRYIDIDNIDDTGTGLFEFVDMGAYEFNCNYTGGDINCDGVVDFKVLAIICANWLAGAEPEL